MIVTFSCRVSKIAEDIMSEQDENCASTDDSEEGAKICKMLEQAAEPEVMMAGLTSEQMISFSSYQANQKVCTIIPRIHQLVLGKLRSLCHYISGS